MWWRVRKEKGLAIVLHAKVPEASLGIE